MSNTDDILKRPIRNFPTPSEFGFRLNLANHIARNETADLERVKHVQTPPVVRTLRQTLQVARDRVIEVLGK